MTIKVTKGQICADSISKKLCREEYYLCGKFHTFMKKCTIFVLCCYTIVSTCSPEPLPNIVISKRRTCTCVHSQWFCTGTSMFSCCKQVESILIGIFLKPHNSLVLAHIKVPFCLTVPEFEGLHSATKCLSSWPLFI